MKIPNYVKEVLAVTDYDIDAVDTPNAYVMKVFKRTPMSKISTLQKDVENLKHWIDIKTGDSKHMKIVNIPSKTEYSQQYASIIIYEPIASLIESYLSKDISFSNY